MCYNEVHYSYKVHFTKLIILRIKIALKQTNGEVHTSTDNVRFTWMYFIYNIIRQDAENTS